MFQACKFSSRHNARANKIITDAFPSRDFTKAHLPSLTLGSPLAVVCNMAGVTELWSSRIYGQLSGAAQAKSYEHLLFSHPPGPTQISLRERWEKMGPPGGIPEKIEWLNRVSVDLETRLATESEEFLSSKIQYTSTDGHDRWILAGAAFMHLFTRNAHFRGQLQSQLQFAGVNVVLDAPAIVDCVADDLIRKH